MRTVAVSGLALACVVVLDITRRYLKNTSSPYPLPPGPGGLPFIGNVIGVDPDAPWLTYAEWAKIYGNCNAGLALCAQAGDPRRPYLYPNPRKGHYHHQFGGGRKGITR